mmetsp:Transcript_125045/g.216139  ORF Transcript_125045/g.216139 Transcript_125045/m.216139 type:complete len:342 (-) Transcript_125045:117-1142(-)
MGMPSSSLVSVFLMMVCSLCAGDNGQSDACVIGSNKFATGSHLLQVHKEQSPQRSIAVQSGSVMMQEKHAWPEGLLGKPLAFDVGLYNGRDTMELLRSGHRVVAVEANPVRYKNASKIFSKFIDSGLLNIVHGVLSKNQSLDAGETMPFYVRKGDGQWSSLMPNVACRHSYFNKSIDMEKCDKIEVNIVTCAGLLQQFGSPYFMKLDIEGHEMSCLQELAVIANQSKGRIDLPQFVSMEVNGGTIAFLSSMRGLGYSRVKTVSQATFHDWSGPYGDLAEDQTSGTQWNDLSTYEVPKCSGTGWCDFHIGFGPAHKSGINQSLSHADMEVEVMALAQVQGLV